MAKSTSVFRLFGFRGQFIVLLLDQIRLLLELLMVNHVYLVFYLITIIIALRHYPIRDGSSNPTHCPFIPSFKAIGVFNRADYLF